MLSGYPPERMLPLEARRLQPAFGLMQEYLCAHIRHSTIRRRHTSLGRVCAEIHGHPHVAPVAWAIRVATAGERLLQLLVARYHLSRHRLLRSQRSRLLGANEPSAAEHGRDREPRRGLQTEHRVNESGSFVAEHARPLVEAEYRARQRLPLHHRLADPDEPPVALRGAVERKEARQHRE